MVEQPASAGRFALICFGYNAWSRMWKRNQQMVAWLARAPWISRALFVNPDARLAQLLTHPLRELRAPAGERWKSLLPQAVDEKVRTFTVCRLPYASRLPTLDRLTRRLLRRVMRDYVAGDFLLLINTPLDPADPDLRPLFEQAALRIFDWSDDFEEFAADAAERLAVRRACTYYLRHADLVFTVNERLRERARALNPAAYTVRNATSFSNFSRAATAALPVARPVRRLPRPVVGYMGWLNEQRLDQAIIEHLVASRPEWSFVFIGPRVSRTALARSITGRRNVHVLKPVAYDELPAYLKAFDVCIIPHKLNAYTAGNDPIKIYDYLAAGKPVVSTRIVGAETFGEVVRIADDGPAFLAGVEEALAADGEAIRARRLAVAREHSWEARMRLVSRLVLEHVLACGRVGPETDAWRAGA